MTSHALLSSERMDWQTPPWFLDLVRRVFPIGLDPATAETNPTRARVYGTQTRGSGRSLGDGLVLEWRPWLLPGEGFFVNPPYSAHLSGEIDATAEIIRKDKTTGERRIVGYGTGWGAKIAQEFRKPDALGIALVPVRTEVEWFNTMWDAATLVCLWRSPVHGSRISFVDPLTGKAVQGSNLASAVFFSGPTEYANAFLSVFRAHGRVLPAGRLIQL